MNDQVLLVDDEPNVLQSFQRVLRGACNLATATGGEQALAYLAEHKDVAVVISDMQMPNMNGVELLAKVKSAYPNIVRVMLTGNADQKTAASAINEGHIFRFLSKPCTPPEMLATIRASIDHHHVLCTEADMLNRTVNGVIQTLTSILSLSWPEAFGTAQQGREIAKSIAIEMNLSPLWPIEIAAMLSRIGCVSLPEPVAQAYFAGDNLNPAQRQVVDQHPHFGQRLLSNIPRLETVANIIGQLHQPPVATTPVESRVVRAVMEYQRQRRRLKHVDAIDTLRDRTRFDQDIVDLLDQVLDRDTEIRSVMLSELKPGMVLDTSIENMDGMVLVGKSVEVHEALLHKLSAYRRSGQGIREPIRVRIPHAMAQTNSVRSLEPVLV